jgi:hypothetical protein
MSVGEWENKGTGSEMASWVMGCFWIGPERFPHGPFYFFPSFLLFLFLFSISFITISFELKIRSNQILNFSKIQGNILDQ